jgi:hypothetical protein
VAERDYQRHLVRRLKREFPGCIVLKNDSSYLQGIPDLTFLFWGRWAFLEVKTSEGAPVQPNQEYYIEQAVTMSFGAFIYPENEEEVFDELQRTFALERPPRLS